jgi:SAM-dependent methyltransferase
MTRKPTHRRAWSAANPGNRAAREELLGAIRRAAGPLLCGGGDLLDCGCGNGWLLEALVAAGVASERLHGADADADRVAAAARRVPGAAVILADAGGLPYPDRSFAAVFQIVSLSSMGGAEPARAALAESRRVLAPGGLLLVYEPRLPNPLNRRTRRLRHSDLEAAGLAIAESSSLTLLPPLGRRLGRLTPALHPRLSRLPPLRSHRLLALRFSDRGRALEDGRSPAGRRREPLRTR